MGITQGDYNGIGPEVILKALENETMLELCTPVIFADYRIIERAISQLGLEMPPMQKVSSAADASDSKINIVDLRLSDAEVTPGRPTAASGAASVASLEAAMQAISDGDIDVLVTAPISKEAVQSEAFHFPGHTEYLEAKAGDGAKAQMILFDKRLRVALVTTHLPVSEIAGAISTQKIADNIRSLTATLTSDFGIERPKIAVLSLNPHCGDGGLLGNEENDIIIPAIDECIGEGILAFGPYAADGFFGSGAYRNFDGVLAMYHDQGLAPFKTLAGDGGVNFTAGLPFVRTSPDHGTAYDIARKGEADAASMREAIYSAIDIRRNRDIYLEASANPLQHTPTERPPRKPKTDNP